MPTGTLQTLSLGNQHGACALQGPQYITEDLYHEEGKKNPGEQGYGSTPTRASLAVPTAVNHRSRTGRPVVVRAACMQVSALPQWLFFVGCLNFSSRCSALVVSSKAVAILVGMNNTKKDERLASGRMALRLNMWLQEVARTKLRMPVVRPKLSMMAAAPRSATASAWKA